MTGDSTWVKKKKQTDVNHLACGATVVCTLPVSLDIRTPSLSRLFLPFTVIWYKKKLSDTQTDWGNTGETRFYFIKITLSRK